MFHNDTDLQMAYMHAASLFFQSVQKYNKTQTLEQIYSRQQNEAKYSKKSIFLFLFFVLRKYEC